MTKTLAKEVAELRAEIAELRTLITALQAAQLRSSWTSLFGGESLFDRIGKQAIPTMGIRVTNGLHDPYINDSPDDWNDDE